MAADSCTAIGGRVALHQSHVVGSDRDQRDAESRLGEWHSSVVSIWQGASHCAKYSN